MAIHEFVKGCKFQVDMSATATPSYTDLCSLQNWTGPSASAPTIDVTGVCDAKRVTVSDPMGGETTIQITYNVVHDNAVHIKLRDAGLAPGPVPTSIKIKQIFSDAGATEYTYTANVSSYSETGSIGGVVTASATLTLTTAITFS